MFYIFHPNPVLNPLLLKITLKALKYMRNIETRSSFVFFLGPSLSPVPRILIYAADQKLMWTLMSQNIFSIWVNKIEVDP